MELEGRCGLSAMALRVPGMVVRPFRLPGNDASVVTAGAPARLRAALHVDAGHRATLLFGDPFSIPMPQVLAALGPADGAAGVNVLGGMASGASQPGQNVLLLDGSTSAFGAVGVTLSGDVRIDALVSQGCRPVGDPLVVTKAQGNVALELGGRPAMEAAQAMARSLPEAQRALLGKGVLFGLALDAYKPRFGRGDFLVRPILGADRKTGALAVGDMLRIGQTMQFHVRDDRTADEDLRLLLDGQQLDAPPLATMLFTCNGRGTRLFPNPHHDAALVHQRLGHAPLAGFFAAGEIGPVGGHAFLHGHTAVCAVVRE
ncbi:MAG: FIST N-terminal domain-containing protein [Phycisphaerales bacterium]